MGSKIKVTGGILIVLIALFVGYNIYAEKQLKKEVDKAIANAAPFVTIEYEDVGMDLFGPNKHITNVAISPVGKNRTTTIKDVTILDFDGKNKIPLHMHVSFNGITISGEDTDESLKGLKELGYENLTANMEIDYRYDSGKKEFHLNRFNWGADKAGKFELELHLGNIDLSPDNYMAILFTFPQIAIQNARLTYKDDSLVSRIQKKAASESGEDVESFKNKLSSKIDKEIAKTYNDSSIESLNALKEFIRDPNEISISISPDEPLPLGELQKVNDPDEIIRMLNLKIST